MRFTDLPIPRSDTVPDTGGDVPTVIPPDTPYGAGYSVGVTTTFDFYHDFTRCGDFQFTLLPVTFPFNLPHRLPPLYGGYDVVRYVTRSPHVVALIFIRWRDDTRVGLLDFV